MGGNTNTYESNRYTPPPPNIIIFTRYVVVKRILKFTNVHHQYYNNDNINNMFVRTTQIFAHNFFGII